MSSFEITPAGTDQISGFGERALAAVHEQPAGRRRLVVGFAHVGPADEVEMGTRLEPRAPHQRARGESRAGNDVRPADGFRQIAGRRRGHSFRRVARKDVRDLDDDRAVPAPCRLYQHRARRADLVAMAERRFAAFAKRALEPVDQGWIIEQRLRPSGVDDAHQSAEPGNAVAEARFRPPGARRPVRQRPDIHPIAMPASNPAAADPSNQIAAGISKEPGNGHSVSATGARFSKANTPTTSASGTNSAIPASRFTSRPVFRATCRSGGRACPCRP